MVSDHIELVRQLLAKAESTTYPAERDTFMEHAQRLIIRYGIGAEQLDGQSARSIPTFVEKGVRFTGVYRVPHGEGLYQVVHTFGLCSVWSDERRDSDTLMIVGEPGDVDAMWYLADSLHTQAEWHMRQWWSRKKRYYTRRTSYGQLTARRQYLNFFYLGVNAKVRTLVAEEMDAAGGEPVLLGKRSRAEQWRNSQHDLTSSPVKKKGDPSRYQDAVEDGWRAHIATNGGVSEMKNHLVEG